MTEDELIERHPRLWHMAADGGWEGIRDNGLMSVTRLLDLYEVEGQPRFAIESARRPQSVVLRKAGLPNAVVRDNKPMFESVLAKNLQDGLQPREWYEILNRKSFFWVDHERLVRLLSARAYAGSPQVVIEVDTRALLERHLADVRLCAINSGQTLYGGQPRGLSTFMRIEDFPSGEGKVGSKTRPRIVELVVEGGVPDIAEMVVNVERLEDGAAKRLWP